MTASTPGSYQGITNLSITDAMFVNTDNNEKVIPGIRSATVRSDINELENLIEIPYEELFDRYNRGLPAGTSQDPRIIIRSVDWYSHHLYNLIRQPDAENSHLIYENDKVSLDIYMQGKPDVTDPAGNLKRYARFFVFDDSDVGDDLVSQKVPSSKGAFNWVKCVELFLSYESNTPVNSTPLFKITSKQEFLLSEGMVYINFRCRQVSAWLVGNEGVETFPKAQCRLKIGSNTYWNGSTWIQNNSPVNFDLSFTSEGAKTNRPSYEQQYGGDIVNVPQYDGYGARVTGTLRGVIEFTVVNVYPFITIDPDHTPPQRAFINGFLPLHDFEIGFVRGSIEDTIHRGNTFKKLGGNFNDEANVDLIFASDFPYGTGNYIRRMPAGLGYVLDSDEKPMEKIFKIVNERETDVPVVPEEELARLISFYGSTTHRAVTLSLNSSMLGTPTPRHRSYTSQELSDIGGFFPLAVSHNWHDDITTLTLIKVTPPNS